MRTVKTKKELIQAINDGEKHIKIDSKTLYASCKLAETFDSVESLLKYYAVENIMSSIGPVGTMNIVADSTVVVVSITVSVLVATIAIIGILKDKKVVIRCKGFGGGKGEIEIG